MVSKPVGPNPLVWEPPGIANFASVEPIGSKVPYRSQWRNLVVMDAARRKGSPPANE